MPRGKKNKNKQDTFELAAEVANQAYEAEVNPLPLWEVIRAQVGWVLGSLIFSGFNAYFYVDKSIQYVQSQSKDPNSPETRADVVESTVSTTLSNFVTALYGCMLLAAEFRKPYGSRNYFIIAFGIGCLSALPSFFTYALGATGSPGLVYFVGSLVVLGNIPTQSLGVLKFLKDIWSWLKTSILTSRVGYLFGNREVFSAQNKLVDEFLKSVGAEVNRKIVAGENIDYGANLLENGTGFLQQFMTRVDLRHEIRPTRAECLANTLYSVGGVATALATMGTVWTAGTITSAPSTYYGISDQLLPEMGSFGAGSLAGIATAITIGPSFLRTCIFGYKFGRDVLFGVSMAVFGYVYRLIKNRELRRPELPLWIQLAKVGTFAAVILVSFMVSKSFATAMRLLMLVYGTEDDKAHPHKIKLSPSFFGFLQKMVPPAAIILNISGGFNVIYAAMLFLTNAVLKAVGSQEWDRNINHAVLQEYLQVFKETPISELARELSKKLTFQRLVEMTGLPEDEVKRLVRIIEGYAQLADKIAEKKDNLELIAKNLLPYGGRFCWKKSPDDQYIQLKGAQAVLKAEIKALELRLKVYPAAENADIAPDAENSPLLQRRLIN